MTRQAEAAQRAIAYDMLARIVRSAATRPAVALVAGPGYAVRLLAQAEVFAGQARRARAEAERA